MKYINIYLNKPSKNNTPIPHKSYNKQQYQYEEDSANIIIRTDGNKKTVKTYSRYKYFCELEDFNATEEPEKIKAFTEEEPKIKKDAAIDQPKQEEPQENKSNGLIKKPKTSQAQLNAVKRYEEKNKDNIAIVKLKVTPDYKEMLFGKAKSKGMTVTAYIKYLVDNDI